MGPPLGYLTSELSSETSNYFIHIYFYRCTVHLEDSLSITHQQCVFPCAGRYVDVPPCTWKHALNTQHTPTHDMLPHSLHYWNVHIYSDLTRIISAP